MAGQNLSEILDFAYHICQFLGFQSMLELPVLSGREVIKILKKIGFEEKRRKGFEKGKRGVVVPDHKEIDKGTLVEIIRQAGLKREEFLKLL